MPFVFDNFAQLSYYNRPIDVLLTMYCNINKRIIIQHIWIEMIEKQNQCLYYFRWRIIVFFDARLFNPDNF